jgi:hypothetical protein
MKTSVFADPIAGLRSAAIAASAFLLGGCLVAPPGRHVEAREGLVRAPTQATAERVARALDNLRPQVLALLPDARRGDLEVWVQGRARAVRVPGQRLQRRRRFLRRRPAAASTCAKARITSNARWRTSSCTPRWATRGAACRARSKRDCAITSRCSCARSPRRASPPDACRAPPFATGGLALEIDLAEASVDRPGEHDVCWSARLRSKVIRASPSIRCACSTSSRSVVERSLPSQKKAFYGIAFLVIGRIARRVGIDGLHGMCEQANAEGLSQIPAERLLEAAGLGLERESLRAAIELEFGPREIEELVRAHPSFWPRPWPTTCGRATGKATSWTRSRRSRPSSSVSGPKAHGLAIRSLAPFEGEIAQAFRTSRSSWRGADPPFQGAE